MIKFTITSTKGGVGKTTLTATFRKKARSSAARVSSLNTLTDSASVVSERPTCVLRSAWSDAIRPFLHTSR